MSKPFDAGATHSRTT
jgi:hypothetical protein